MPEVKVYSTPSCPWCKRAKKFLEDNSIPFKDIDVAADKAAREEMIRKSGQLGVPVIEIDGEIVIGYNEPKMKEKLIAPPK